MKITKTKDGRDSILITTSLITEVVTNVTILRQEMKTLMENGIDVSRLEKVLDFYMEMYEVFLQHDGEGPEAAALFKE